MIQNVENNVNQDYIIREIKLQNSVKYWIKKKKVFQNKRLNQKEHNIE